MSSVSKPVGAIEAALQRNAMGGFLARDVSAPRPSSARGELPMNGEPHGSQRATHNLRAGAGMKSHGRYWCWR
jgi:hypothetical protein